MADRINAEHEDSKAGLKLDQANRNSLGEEADTEEGEEEQTDEVDEADTNRPDVRDLRKWANYDHNDRGGRKVKREPKIQNNVLNQPVSEFIKFLPTEMQAKVIRKARTDPRAVAKEWFINLVDEDSPPVEDQLPRFEEL